MPNKSDSDVILCLQLLSKTLESVLDKSSNEVGHVMVLYSPDWTNLGFSFILLTVNLFRHSTLIEHRQ